MSFEISKILLALLVLINPSGALSVYLELTRQYSRRERRRVAQIAGLSVFLIIAVFAICGTWLLNALGISAGSFRVGGGMLMFLIAVSLMNSGVNPAKPDIGTDDSHEIHLKSTHPAPATIAVVPLAMPMMAGPGGISTVVIYATAATSVQQTLAIIAAGALVALFCTVCLLLAERVSGLLGQTGLTILNRIMGMLLAAISVEIVVAGLRNLFPQLAA
ncbi:MAG: MarC family protein [Alysiella sp.]|uniref:MarC family protein n=1 Tax=Alysiella sp. TaxID=1872483 RepID=UPI0026DC4206|nr:MarC family protein [Alysiella sp.]MDO4434544.1 MarC family protein [Alysiella sp.]